MEARTMETRTIEDTIEELSKKIETIDQATRILIRVLIDRMEILETEIVKLKEAQEQPK